MDEDNCTYNASDLFTYISCKNGAQSPPMIDGIIATVLYMTIYVTGIFGNIVTCLVIIKNSYMQTATNYYLFNLAISDVTLLIIGLPTDLLTFWQRYPWPSFLGLPFCKIKSFATEVCFCVSVLTIVAFTMERYMAICHPLYFHVISGVKRASIIILGIWIISFVCGYPVCYYSIINYLNYPKEVLMNPSSRIIEEPDICGNLMNVSSDIFEESAECGILKTPEIPIFELSAIFFFIIPMIIIAVCYTIMGLTLWRSTRKSAGSATGSSVHGDSQTNSRKSMVKMLSAVVIMFFICWAPFHFQRVHFVYYCDIPALQDLAYYIRYVAAYFYYFSSTVNPLLYNVMSAKYRKAFKEILCNKRNGSTGQFSRGSSLYKTGTQLDSVSSLRSSFSRMKNKLRSSTRSRMDKEEDNTSSNEQYLRVDQNGVNDPLLKTKVSPAISQGSESSSTTFSKLEEKLSTASSTV